MIRQRCFFSAVRLATPEQIKKDSAAPPLGKVDLIGFVLSDCVVEVDEAAAKYLRAVHRTALELAVQNQFGAEIGGFWLMAEQIGQLRRLPEYYPANESQLVARAVDAYLHAQMPKLH